MGGRVDAYLGLLSREERIWRFAGDCRIREEWTSILGSMASYGILLIGIIVRISCAIEIGSTVEGDLW